MAKVLHFVQVTIVIIDLGDDWSQNTVLKTTSRHFSAVHIFVGWHKLWIEGRRQQNLARKQPRLNAVDKKMCGKKMTYSPSIL